MEWRHGVYNYVHLKCGSICYGLMIITREKDKCILHFRIFFPPDGKVSTSGC